MSEWLAKSLGELAEVRVSNVDKKSIDGEIPVRLCNYMDVYSSTEVDDALPFMRATASRAEVKRFGLRDGDVVITKDSESPDDIAVPAYVSDVGDDVVCGYHLAILRPTGLANGKYLSYLLRTEAANRHFARTATGSTRYGLSIRSIKSAALIIRSSKDEQRRIADLLSALDEQVLALSATIEKKKALRAGVVRRLILGPNRPTGWKLHGLAKDWDVSKFGAEFTLQLGKMLSSVAKTGSGEVPYLGNRNVQWRRFELESLETMYFNPRERLKYELRQGDLLICEGGEVGRAAVWQGAPFECFYQKAIHRARTSSGRVLPEFALAILELASELGWFADYVVQTSIAHLPREKLMEFPLPIPSPSEQRVICSAIDAINQDVEVDAQAMAKLTKMSHGLRAALLQPETC